MQIFASAGDYLAFEKTMAQACERTAMRLLAYCVMPNHWHLVVWPRAYGELSQFIGWLTMTHTQRWHVHRRTTGCGHVYQGRFKSFPVQSNSHFLTLCRYVERNALRAGLVKRAEDWPYCSLYRRKHRNDGSDIQLSQWPVARPGNWGYIVNQPQSEEELEALRLCVKRDRPFGTRVWTRRAVKRFGLESAIRPRGRPRKSRKKKKKGS